MRLLAPLAFVSPQLVSEIAAGTAPATLKVTSFAEALPYLWNRQGTGCLTLIEGSCLLRGKLFRLVRDVFTNSLEPIELAYYRRSGSIGIDQLHRRKIHDEPSYRHRYMALCRTSYRPRNCRAIR